MGRNTKEDGNEDSTIKERETERKKGKETNREERPGTKWQGERKGQYIEC